MAGCVLVLDLYRRTRNSTPSYSCAFTESNRRSYGIGMCFPYGGSWGSPKLASLHGCD